MELNILELRAKAFDYLFDAVVVTDGQGIITDWNSGSELLYGYTKEEAIGQPASILHVLEDSDSITSLVLSSVEKYGKWNGEIRYLHKDGHIGWLESICIPVFDDKQQMIGALGINRDITTRIEETKKLEYQAHYDPLTKLPNRALFFERLEKTLAISKRKKHSFAILFIDLDDFKSINDKYGHNIGDELLHEVSRKLESCIRESDTVGRISGDEFVILLTEIASHDEPGIMAERIIKTVSSPIKIKDSVCNIGVSIGISLYPEHSSDLDELLILADKAMYHVKHFGKNSSEYAK
ncbi:diguanylate cyclase [Sulfurimonas aquatica]|uniref:Diguanylate cyclase n=1 Tax=Sulfurimonas aquatica TaxID=2672570 RepID=A0A975GBY9_9BACT|nr:GGDEF domain-containing protein [Sulfurimonas aquatica]QSZ41075.1 diguanylate cyclase [Sulfurimonas aquatica]